MQMCKSVVHCETERTETRATLPHFVSTRLRSLKCNTSKLSIVSIIGT